MCICLAQKQDNYRLPLHKTGLRWSQTLLRATKVKYQRYHTWLAAGSILAGSEKIWTVKAVKHWSSKEAKAVHGNL